MPCYDPLTAWRTETGSVVLTDYTRQATQLKLPCGKCIGCTRAQAKAWALRCELELTQHTATAFTTLTYDDTHRPPTLRRRHLSLWLKRLRRHRSMADRALRFFASGEYGEQNQRPHYHAIVFGCNADHDSDVIHDTWGQGHTKTVHATPATIAYVAGYTAKKLSDRRDASHERVDPETGEIFFWQPPFIQMSRRPGIGGHARQWPASWRDTAIHGGQPMPVPRFLHEAWKNQATEEDLKTLAQERTDKAQQNENNHYDRRQAAEQIAHAKHNLTANKRKL